MLGRCAQSDLATNVASSHCRTASNAAVVNYGAGLHTHETALVSSVLPILQGHLLVSHACAVKHVDNVECHFNMTLCNPCLIRLKTQWTAEWVLWSPRLGSHGWWDPGRL